MTELLPCPFCGSKETLTFETDGVGKWGWIACGCDGRGPDVRTGYATDNSWHPYAVEQWNARAGISASASREECPLCNILTAPPVCHVAGCKSSRVPSQCVPNRVADWLDDQARIATNSLHCGDNSLTIQRTHAWAAELEAAAQRLRADAPALPEGERCAVADQMIGAIEDRFPDWRSYRDLIDCIDCTLHRLREAQS